MPFSAGAQAEVKHVKVQDQKNLVRMGVLQSWILERRSEKGRFEKFLENVEIIYPCVEQDRRWGECNCKEANFL